VLAEYPLDALSTWRPSGTGLGRYVPLLPVGALPAAMGEGGTPLVRARRVAAGAGERVYLKLESLNPTGSYKDRIASVGVAVALVHGKAAVAATSSGNAGAAIAAYAARAGLGAVLVVPAEVPPAKLLQIQAYGAVVIPIRGVLGRADGSSLMFDAVVRAAAARDWLPMITAHRYAPAAMEGVKTLAFEIVEALGDAPHRVYAPVGGGGLLAAAWRGFEQANALGWATRVPRMIAVQPEGCAPVARAAQGGTLRAAPVRTEVSGLQVSVPPDGALAVHAVRASGGCGIAVSDEAIFDAARRLALEESIFAEPAGATAVAGLLADVAAGRLGRDETAVCLITGTGFKDPKPFIRHDVPPALDVDALDRLADVAQHEMNARAG